LLTFSGHRNFKTLIKAKFSPAYTNCRYIYCGSHCEKAYIYDTLTGGLVDVLSGWQNEKKKLHNDFTLTRDVAWHPYKPCLVQSTFKGYLNVYNFSG